MPGTVASQASSLPSAQQPRKAGTRNRGSRRFASLPRVAEAGSVGGEAIETVGGSPVPQLQRQDPGSLLRHPSLACPHLLTIPPGPWLDRTLRRRSEGPKGGRRAARHSVVSRKPFYSSGSGIQQTPSLGLSGPWGPSDVGLPSWGSLFLLSASYHQDCLWGGVACPIQVEGLRALRILDATWCPLFPVQPGANPSPPSPPSAPHFGYGRVSAGGQQRGPAVTQAPGALALSLLSPSPWEGVESFLSPAGRHIEIASRLWGGLTTWTLDLKVGSLCL